MDIDCFVEDLLLNSSASRHGMTSRKTSRIKMYVKDALQCYERQELWNAPNDLPEPFEYRIRKYATGRAAGGVKGPTLPAENKVVNKEQTKKEDSTTQHRRTKADSQGTRIVINASDLAKYTGHNTFCTPEEVSSQFWTTNKKLAQELGAEYKSKSFSHTEELVSNISRSERNELRSTLGLDRGASDQAIAHQLRECVVKPATCSSTNAGATKKLCQATTKVVAGLSEESVQMAKRAFEKDTQISRGIAREKNSIDNFQKSTGQLVIEQNARRFTKSIGKCRNYDIMLVGKVDGMLQSTGEVVEVKERRKRLFGRVVDYEKVQLHAYMFLTSTSRIMLRERFDSDSREYWVDFDTEFWKCCLKTLDSFLNGMLFE